MVVTLRNLGPVREAVIDLSKPFTVFCGPNSTGKTYVAYVLYFLLGKLQTTVFSRFADATLFKGEASYEVTQQELDEWCRHMKSIAAAALSGIFAVSDEKADEMFKDFQIGIDLGKDALQRFIEYDDNGTIAIGSHKVIKWTKPAGSASITVFPLDEVEYARDLDGTLVSSIACMAIRECFTGVRFNTRMLTVERNSINTFKTQLALASYDQLQLIGQQAPDSTYVARYPLAVSDSLKTAIDLENITKRQSGFGDIAGLLEKEILGGTVSVGDHGQMLFAPQEQPDMKLGIQMASSLVKALASLDIYLRHLAHRHDCLIIDEPEMNLHPELQRLLARVFAIMVNNGIRLIVSTHSDYILRELNSLVMADSLRRHGDEQTAQRYGIAPGMMLKPGQVQPVMFTPESDGRSTARGIDVDGYGFNVAAIDRAIDSQNDMAITLTDTLDSYAAES